MSSWQIVGLIILGIILDLGGGPTHDHIGFRYWMDSFNQLNGIPGATGRFLAFWTTFVNAAFSFLGVEIVALAAAETENPRHNVPKAVTRVFYRILLFYVGGVIVIGLLVPYHDSRLLGASTAASSPFVIAIENAKIKVLPSIINAAILTSAFSAGNSLAYASSRTLYGLACIGQAPGFLRICTKNGLPVWSVFITCKIQSISSRH
jgi:yeast amino acid transporter